MKKLSDLVADAVRTTVHFELFEVGRRCDFSQDSAVSRSGVEHFNMLDLFAHVWELQT